MKEGTEMYGAILGDIVGSPYEFDFNNIKTKEFPLFGRYSTYTDDSVMSLAVSTVMAEQSNRMYSFNIPAQSYYNGEPYSDDELKQRLIESMREYGATYPYAGYGTRFSCWLESDDPQPYNSYGNGSAMRVSSVGWLFKDIDTTRKMARISAEVTHNHPEGIKGAEAVASAIFLARIGHSKEKIRNYIVEEFGYDLSSTCDKIRPDYHHVESCQKTVPEAITAFLEGESFEDVIRTAVSLGGDSDTLTCIAGSIAEAYYLMPVELIGEVEKRLPEELYYRLRWFNHHRIPSIAENQKKKMKKDDIADINEYIDEVVRVLVLHVYHDSYESARTLITRSKTVQECYDEGEPVERTAIDEGYACG